MNSDLLYVIYMLGKRGVTTGGEIFHEGPKLKNLQNTRMKFKKNITRGKTGNDIYYRG